VRIAARPLAPGEVDFEFVAVSTSLAAFGLGAAWWATRLPWPVCAFHALTGYPCITCGATRSAIAFFHGRFLSSWNWNPLAFAAYCLIAIFNAYAFVAVISRGRRLRIVQITNLERNFARWSLLALVAGNWIYLLMHAGNFQ